MWKCCIKWKDVFQKPPAVCVLLQLERYRSSKQELLEFENAFICIANKSSLQLKLLQMKGCEENTHTNTYIKSHWCYLVARLNGTQQTILFYMSRLDDGQRLCIILAWGPKFLTWQFAVFSLVWAVTIGRCRLIRSLFTAVWKRLGFLPLGSVHRSQTSPLMSTNLASSANTSPSL